MAALPLFGVNDRFFQTYGDIIWALREGQLGSLTKWLQGGKFLAFGRRWAFVPLPAETGHEAMSEWLALFQTIPPHLVKPVPAIVLARKLIQHAESRGFLAELADPSVAVLGYSQSQPLWVASGELGPLSPAAFPQAGLWRAGLFDTLAAIPDSCRLLSLLPPFPPYAGVLAITGRTYVGDPIYDRAIPKVMAHGNAKDIKYFLRRAGYPADYEQGVPEQFRLYCRGLAHTGWFASALRNRRPDVFDLALEKFGPSAPPGGESYTYTGQVRLNAAPPLNPHELWSLELGNHHAHPDMSADKVRNARFRKLVELGYETAAQVILRARPTCLPSDLSLLADLSSPDRLKVFLAATITNPAVAPHLRRELLAEEWWGGLAAPRGEPGDYAAWAYRCSGRNSRTLPPPEVRERFCAWGAPIPIHVTPPRGGSGELGGPFRTANAWVLASAGHCWVNWPQKEGLEGFPAAALYALEGLLGEPKFALAPLEAQERAVEFLLWLVAPWLLLETLPGISFPRSYPSVWHKRHCWPARDLSTSLTSWFAAIHKKWRGLDLLAIYGGALATLGAGGWDMKPLPATSANSRACSAALAPYTTLNVATRLVFVLAGSSSLLQLSAKIESELRAVASQPLLGGPHQYVSVRGWCVVWRASARMKKMHRILREKRRLRLAGHYREHIDVWGGKLGLSAFSLYGRAAPLVTRTLNARLLDCRISLPPPCAPEPKTLIAYTLLAAKRDVSIALAPSTPPEVCSLDGLLGRAPPPESRLDFLLGREPQPDRQSSLHQDLSQWLDALGLEDCRVAASTVQLGGGAQLLVVTDVEGVSFVNHSYPRRLEMLRRALSPGYGWPPPPERTAPGPDAFFAKEAADLAKSLSGRVQLWVAAACTPPAGYPIQRLLAFLGETPPASLYGDGGWLVYQRSRPAGGSCIAPLVLGSSPKDPKPWSFADLGPYLGALPGDAQTSPAAQLYLQLSHSSLFAWLEAAAISSHGPEPQPASPREVATHPILARPGPSRPEAAALVDPGGSADPDALHQAAAAPSAVARPPRVLDLGGGFLAESKHPFKHGKVVAPHGRLRSSRAEWACVTASPFVYGQVMDGLASAGRKTCSCHLADIVTGLYLFTEDPLVLPQSGLLVASHSIYSVAASPGKLVSWAMAAWKLAVKNALLLVRTATLEGLPEKLQWPDGSWVCRVRASPYWGPGQAEECKASWSWAASKGAPRTRTILSQEALVEAFGQAGWALVSASSAWAGPEKELLAASSMSSWAAWCGAEKDLVFERT